MELQYLKDFVVLERIRNYTLAAEQLYTTEATLSRHIKALEKELRRPLFLRTTRRVELTEFGQKFLVYAMDMVQTMEKCEANLLNAPAAGENLLMIGTFGTVNSYDVIQRALRLLSAEYPECIVGTIQGDLNEQRDKISSRKYDLAIGRESRAEFDDQFERLTILREPLCVVVSKDSPLARRQTVGIAQLNGQKIKMPSKHMLAHHLIVEACRAQGFEPEISSILREGEFIESFVSIGGGIAVLCLDMAMRSANPETQVIRELSPTIYEYINLFFLRSQELPKMARNAIRCFERAVSGE